MFIGNGKTNEPSSLTSSFTVYSSSIGLFCVSLAFLNLIASIVASPVINEHLPPSRLPGVHPLLT